MARESKDAWGGVGVVFRKATIPLGNMERQAVESEPGREEMHVSKCLLTCNLQSKHCPRSTPCFQN